MLQSAVVVELQRVQLRVSGGHATVTQHVQLRARVGHATAAQVSYEEKPLWCETFPLPTFGDLLPSCRHIVPLVVACHVTKCSCSRATKLCSYRSGGGHATAAQHVHLRVGVGHATATQVFYAEKPLR